MAEGDRPFRFPYLAGNGSYWEPSAAKSIRESKSEDAAYDPQKMEELYGEVNIDATQAQLRELLGQGSTRFSPTRAQMEDQSTGLRSGTINLFMEESNKKRKAAARAERAAQRAARQDR